MTNINLTKVMISVTSSPIILMPPKLTSETGHKKLPEDVREWSHTIPDCDEGVDTIDKVAEATRNMILYRLLEISQKKSE